ncbi:MAG: type III secretion chaperone [Rhabdochlamydiaceae bacterium]|nr:type III secretion chaperone [Candidatus Amphrikana amoebophyrae]
MEKIDWKQVLGWGENEISDLTYVGYSYVKEGHYHIALRFFEALVALEPDNLYCMQTLGALYLQTGNHLYALNYLEKSLKKDPLHIKTLLNRAKTLFLLGYKKQATAQTQILLKADDKTIVDRAEALLMAYS